MKVWVFYEYDLSKIWVVEKKPRLSDDRECLLVSKGRWKGFKSNTNTYKYLDSQFQEKSPTALIELEL